MGRLVDCSYELRSVKGTRRLEHADHAAAQRAARDMDRDLQPVYGVEVWLVERAGRELDEPVHVGTHDTRWVPAREEV